MDNADLLDPSNVSNKKRKLVGRMQTLSSTSMATKSGVGSKQASFKNGSSPSPGSASATPQGGFKPQASFKRVASRKGTR